MGQSIHRRRRKLIEPALQLKIIGTFAVLAGISAVLQALVLVRALGTLAGADGAAGSPEISRLRALVVEHLMIGLAICVPIFVVVGIFVTFRVAGPAYRLRRYLEDLARDSYSGPCGIRQGDEFQGLCRALNLAIERLRAESQPHPAPPPGPEASAGALPSRGSRLVPPVQAGPDGLGAAPGSGKRSR